MLKINIYTSDDLQGQTGENGEKFVVFLCYPKNILESGWRWFFTKEEADAFVKEVKICEIGLN